MKIIIFVLGSFLCAFIGVNTNAGLYPLLFGTACISIVLYNLRGSFVRQNKKFLNFIISIAIGSTIGSAFMALSMGFIFFLFDPGDKFPLILIFNILAGFVIGSIANCLVLLSYKDK